MGFGIIPAWVWFPSLLLNCYEILGGYFTSLTFLISRTRVIIMISQWWRRIKWDQFVKCLVHSRNSMHGSSCWLRLPKNLNIFSSKRCLLEVHQAEKGNTAALSEVNFGVGRPGGRGCSPVVPWRPQWFSPSPYTFRNCPEIILSTC